MKTFINLFLVAAMLMFAVNTSVAQTFEYATSKGSTFNAASADSTGYTIEVDGKAYDVFKTTKQAAFIKAISSKTGKVYPVWIGIKTSMEFDGKPVRKSSKGKHFVLVPNKAGYPYAKYLKTK